MSDWRLYELDELGADGYPPIWHERLKHEVRERVEHRCIRCLHPYEQGAGEWSPCDERCTHGGPVRWRALTRPGWNVVDDFGGGLTVGELVAEGNQDVQAAWRILTVHHLDGNKANCRWWNLVALCQRCHLQIQGKVLMARVWPWEHSEWFRPYVAAYYAHAYLGEDLSREEAEVRQDELLDLERAA